MTNDAHLNQTRNSGKFSFKTNPESESVRLMHDGTMEPVRPVLDHLVRSYSGSQDKGSKQDRARNAAKLNLLLGAADNSSTDEEASRHLIQRVTEADRAAYNAKQKKVGLLDVPGRIRRSREVREARTRLDDARLTESVMRGVMSITRPSR